ncbi:5'-flap endonuclease [Podospora pseudopauciseta]|uniref:Structure-specific endonuclease subunit SLX4 n=1 Tax=Podospora pseudopauciseta TaxID=2093780 RepID=A0ABR0HVP7_9PEZI|nr:5'-flap endonuclease [Podospora pseudopauciseta]
MFSSPPRGMARDECLVVISSSPEFPSLCDLVPTTKPTTLRSGRNAATIPGDASTTFTSAATMWRAAQHPDAEDVSGPEVGIPMPALKDTALDKSKPKFKPRAPTKTRTKKDSPLLVADDSVILLKSSGVDVSVSKKRAKQPKSVQETTQTTIAKGKVTKPATKEKVTKKKMETVSRHFAKESSTSKPPTTNSTDAVVPVEEDEPVILEPALQRRFDWTPPRESLPRQLIPVADSPMERPTWSVESPEANVFKALHDKFGRTSDDVQSVGPGSGTSSLDVLGKRKLIEMVQTAAASISNINANGKALAESPVKSKAVKKKPRTITELATAAYRNQEEPSKQDSLLGYLDTSDAQTGSSNTALRSKGKLGKKPAKPRPSKKKPEPKKPILLSPESALRQVAQQDFVFGTSSQLAIEDDPDLLRALHEAMKLSNDTTDDPFAIPSPVTSDLAVRRKPARLLWGASARDEDGALLDMEILDLTESPPAHSQSRANDEESLDDSVQMTEQSLPPPPTKAPEPMREASPPTPGADEQRHTGNSIFDTTDSSAETGSEAHAPPKFHIANAVVEQIPEPNDADWDDYIDLDLPPSNQEHHEFLLTQSSSPQLAHSPITPNLQPASPSSKPTADPSILLQSGPMAPSRPKYELFTDAQLARDIFKFGFKPVKKRSAMIALLDQCWASRVQSATGGAATSVRTISTTTSQAASKPSTAAAAISPRGRPRKNSGTAAPSADYSSLKVPELKKLLQERSLKQSGNKPDLIARLQDYDMQRKTSAGLASPRGRPRKETASSPKRTKPREKSPARRATSPRRSRSPATTPHRSKPQGKDGVIEIPDSDADSDLDDPILSSPPSAARRARPADEDMFSSPRVDLSINEDAEMSLIASPTTEQVSVFAYITKAITSAPSSKDPTDPSWYEKILMYDPIILEDLALWLNEGQLDKAGYDGEVSPADVKQWCESKSVCCLWRVSLRGLERKRL